MKVADLLATKGREVSTIPATGTIFEATQMLSKHRIGALVVTDDQGGMAGMFSERDLVSQIAENAGRNLHDPVRTIMTHDIVFCSEDDSVNKVMEMMTVNRFRHVPVLREGELCGIISIGEVVKERVRQAEEEAAAMRDYISMS